MARNIGALIDEGQVQINQQEFEKNLKRQAEEQAKRESENETEETEETEDTESTERTVSTGDKILGMPKGVAIGLGISVVLIGGFLLYKKFAKK